MELEGLARSIPLFGQSLANPWMLWTGLAIAIPFAVHLWNRKRTVETPWAATRFLEEAIRETARQVRIERRVLLAIRASTLMALAFALAEPITSDDVLERKPIHLIAVLDTSYSMRTLTDRGTRLAIAKQSIRQAIDQCPAGSRFSLLTCDATCEVVLDNQVSESVAVGELQSLSASDNSADFESVVAPLLKIIQESDATATHETRIVFVSDLAANSWSEVCDSSNRVVFERLSKYQPQLIDVGEEQVANAAVTNVAIKDHYVITGRPTEVDIVVTNYAATSRTGLLTMTVDGHSIEKRLVEVAAFEQASVTVTHAFRASGERRVAVSLENDSLPTDDTFYLIVDVHDVFRVLCVESEPSAADYVATALAVADEAISIERCDALRLPIQLDYDCVVLCDAALMSDDDLSRLTQRVINGCGLVASLGPSTSQLMESVDATELFAPVETLVANAETEIDLSELNHPVMFPFLVNPRTGLNEVSVWKYWKLAASGTTPVLFLTNGDALIQSKDRGVGRIAYVASSLSAVRNVSDSSDWNTIAVLPSFVPLIHRTVVFAAQAHSQAKTVHVTDSIYGPDPARSGSIRFFRSSAPAEAVLIENRRDALWRSPKLRFAGFYQAEQPDRASTTTIGSFAVNVDSSEGDPARIDETLLPDWLTIATDSVIKHSSLPPRSHSWVPLTLFLVAALLVVEPIYVAIAGRQE